MTWREACARSRINTATRRTATGRAVFRDHAGTILIQIVAAPAVNGGSPVRLRVATPCERGLEAAGHEDWEPA